MLRRLSLCLLAVAACGDDSSPARSPDMAPPPTPMPLCSPTIPTPATPSALYGGDALHATGAACAETTTAFSSTMAADIVPTGWIALGPALSFSGPADGQYPHGVDFVVPADLSKAPGAPASDVYLFEKRGAAPAQLLAASNVVVETAFLRVHFHVDGPATFQAAVRQDAGKPRMRHYTYRAVAGVSMGGFGATLNFFLHPDRYDAIAVMGADPGPDVVYDTGMLSDYFFGGFCTVNDTPPDQTKPPVGQLCPSKRVPLTGQFEEPWTWEHMNYQPGEGVGLTLKRTTWMRALRDVMRALGNVAYATAAGEPFLPPGVTSDIYARQPGDICAHPVVLKHFYDARYNPDGKYDVITFCDGGDSQTKGYGIFDPSVPQTDPVLAYLAVDVNGNGVRDSGEPVVAQLAEPWLDVGSDGLADAQEPGYDPVKNPDPNHDDYHWLHNPSGTEGNWQYDKGEPYQDNGLDGVASTKDFGEGNGQFDYSPNIAAWRGKDGRDVIAALSDADFDRLAIYYDAGIHDFLNAQVSTNSLMGAVVARGAGVRVWDGFPSLVDAAPALENKFQAQNVDFTRLGRRAYVRYGNPDTPEATVEQTGEGRHVGSGLEAALRAEMLFYYLSSVWPGGDTTIGSDFTTPDPIDATFTASNGRQTPYSVILPPGYDAPSEAQTRYPVIYMGHGLGMQPKDLDALAVLGQSAMLNENVPPSRRMQKMIIVIADGACRPGFDEQDWPTAMPPVMPTDGDRCEEGTFYSDHPDGGPAQMSKAFVELQQLIESKYRAKTAADVMVAD